MGSASVASCTARRPRRRGAKSLISALAAVVACGRSIRLGFPSTSLPGLKKRTATGAKTFEHYVWAWDKAAPIIGGLRLDRFDRRGVIGLFGALEEGGCSANTIRAVKTVMGIIIAPSVNMN